MKLKGCPTEPGMTQAGKGCPTEPGMTLQAGPDGSVIAGTDRQSQWQSGDDAPLPAQLRNKVLEDVGAEDEREYQSVHGPPEVGCVAYVVHVPLGHVPAVEEVQRREYVAWNRDRDQIDVYSHLRLEEDGGEKDGGNGP